jgi:hypothetical protein
MLIDDLYAKEQDKASFQDQYDTEITLYPSVLGYEDDNGEYNGEPYDTIASYLDPRMCLNIPVRYDPATKDEGHFMDHIHVSRDESWNISGFGEIELMDYYICYAMHVLWHHNCWAFEDILKINYISTEIKVRYGKERF